MFRYQLLGLLRDGEARHGYALVKEYNRRTGLGLKPGQGYRELQRLVEDHMVEHADNPAGADQRRLPYVITKRGRLAFDEWFENIPLPNLGGDGELAARAIFFSEVPRELASSVVSSWRRNLWYLSKVLERSLEIPRLSESEGSAFPLLLKRRKRVAALELQFLEDLQMAFGLSQPAISEEAAPGEKTQAAAATQGMAVNEGRAKRRRS